MTYSLLNDVRDVEAGGSNPLTPTRHRRLLPTQQAAFFWAFDKARDDGDDVNSLVLTSKQNGGRTGRTAAHHGPRGRAGRGVCAAATGTSGCSAGLGPAFRTLRIVLPRAAAHRRSAARGGPSP